MKNVFTKHSNYNDSKPLTDHWFNLLSSSMYTSGDRSGLVRFVAETIRLLKVASLCADTEQLRSVYNVTRNKVRCCGILQGRLISLLLGTIKAKGVNFCPFFLVFGCIKKKALEKGHQISSIWSMIRLKKGKLDRGEN